MDGLVSAQIINFMYRHTAVPLSPIRRLLVTIIEYHLSPDDLDSYEGLLPVDFLFDLCRKLLETRDIMANCEGSFVGGSTNMITQKSVKECLSIKDCD
jgi:hypothetical protein